MRKTVRSFALAGVLALACGGASVLIAGCGSHEGPGRVETDTSKPPLMPPKGGYGSSHSSPSGGPGGAPSTAPGGGSGGSGGGSGGSGG